MKAERRRRSGQASKAASGAGLLLASRGLHRWAGWRGVLDGWFGVGPEEGAPLQPTAWVRDRGDRYPSTTWSVDGEWYSPTVREIAASTTASLEQLGVDAHTAIGPYNVRVWALDAELKLATARATQAAGDTVSERALDRDKDPAKPAYASDDEAQQRRRAQMKQQTAAAAEAAVGPLRVALEEARAERAAVAGALRQTALHIHELGYTTQQLYFTWRKRAWRTRRHGPCPPAHLLVVGLPVWVVDDDELYDPPARTVAPVASPVAGGPDA